MGPLLALPESSTRGAEGGEGTEGNPLSFRGSMEKANALVTSRRRCWAPFHRAFYPGIAMAALVSLTFMVLGIQAIIEKRKQRE